MDSMLSPTENPRVLLEQLCRDKDVGFAALSRLIGRNPAYIQQFVRRGTPSALPERERRMIARHLGVEEWRLGGDPAQAAIDGLATVLPLGSGEEPAGPLLAFDRGWLASLTDQPADRLRTLLVEGDAMAPTLRPGDVLLIDRSAGLADGLFVLETAQGFLPRRINIHPIRNTITVQTDNADYADWPDLDPEEVKAVGRILWVGRTIL